MICPVCKNQYDIYNAVINDDTGNWECPDCKVNLIEEEESMKTYRVTLTIYPVRARNKEEAIIRFLELVPDGGFEIIEVKEVIKNR